MSLQSENVLGGELERTNALSWARWLWRGLMLMPVIVFILIMQELQASPGGGSVWGVIFLVLALLWLALAAPVAYVLRSHCFRASWFGKPVDPESYVRGLITVWVVLEVVAILSLASCAASGSLLPGVLPGTLALILMALSGPSARALGLDEEAA